MDITLDSGSGDEGSIPPGFIVKFRNAFVSVFKGFVVRLLAPKKHRVEQFYSIKFR